MSPTEDVESDDVAELEKQVKALGLLGNRIFAMEAFAESVYRLLTPEQQEKIHMHLDEARNRRSKDVKSILSTTGAEMDERTFNAIFDGFIASLHKAASH